MAEWFPCAAIYFLLHLLATVKSENDFEIVIKDIKVFFILGSIFLFLIVNSFFQCLDSVFK